MQKVNGNDEARSDISQKSILICPIIPAFSRHFATFHIHTLAKTFASESELENKM